MKLLKRLFRKNENEMDGLDGLHLFKPEKPKFEGIVASTISYKSEKAILLQEFENIKEEYIKKNSKIHTGDLFNMAKRLANFISKS